MMLNNKINVNKLIKVLFLLKCVCIYVVFNIGLEFIYFISIQYDRKKYCSLSQEKCCNSKRF